MSSTINSFEYVYPVVGGNPIKEDSTKGLLITNIYGTSFKIGKNILITAGHVLSAVQENKQPFGVGVKKDSNMFFYEADECEIYEEFDLGLLRVDLPDDTPILKWSMNDFPMLSDVSTVGYPFAFDIKNMELSIRSFKGYVVATGNFHDLKSIPRIYELSFQAPKGLSGEPVFNGNDYTQIIGMIIGNKSTKMQILNSIEIIKEKKEKTIEIYDNMKLGVALQCKTIGNIHSKILGSSIQDFLESNKLQV